MKQGFWKTDWFAGLVIALAFLFISNSSILSALERAVYDYSVRISPGDAGDQIAIIGIDDQSLANLGRWPWPRSILADLVDRLADADAKLIGLSILMSEQQIDPGLLEIRKLRQAFESAGISSQYPQLNASLDSAEFNLDTDGKLAASITQAANVVLGMQFTVGEPLGNPDQDLPDFVNANALSNIQDRINALGSGLEPIPALDATPPIARLGESAAAVGHLVPGLNSRWEFDARLEPLVLRYFDQYFPSLALQIAAHSLNLNAQDIIIKLGEGVQLGRLNIATNDMLMMHTFFYSGEAANDPFPVDSFFDVYSGKIPVSKYTDKIVLIGATAYGLGSTLATPLSSTTEPAKILAHTVASILNEDFFIVPAWAGLAEWLVFILVAAYLMFLLPRLKAAMAAGLSVLLLLLLLGTEIGLMTTQAMWVQLMSAISLLIVGHLLLTTKRFLITESGKLKADAASADSNRMLGLAFQQQGQLDMAFEKFRQAPLDDDILDPIYNLAMDFERKRQFNKAASAYQYIHDYKPEFRDLQERLKRAKNLENTVILGGGSSSGSGGSLLLDDGGVSTPMLGRYEIEKELGKGAMGTVYLGKDPKINRVVAIKTMALADEFEEDELVEVKERFFREAETAGRLTHPNIVTMYDAGEEHDLAYIAMEYLAGHDLVRYTKADGLLPVPKVMAIIYKAADALNYAHSLNVVHRDIKPGNIMFDPRSGTLKLTDFGIARITDSSKTKTGMVLGTPSYMSPEQLSGKKVDGRSDLFSLGVTLYQLLCGQLPFKGESMATLMYKIANEQEPDILSVRPQLASIAPGLGDIIARALAKEVAERYQSGAEMATDLKRCARKMSRKT